MIEIDDVFDKDGGKRFAVNINTVKIAVLNSEEIAGIVV